MDAPVAQNIENEPHAGFVTEFDSVPDFWNYLLGLHRDDLVAELIQNDLDQDATRTVISFEQDRLVCQGNGRPVEEDGWKRLRKIRGAGDSVPAKRGRIGVKNHGLKTAFTIGDEIRLMSGERAIVQTLYKNGRSKPPHPGASVEPFADPEAPAQGCRIVIHYRDAPLAPPQGEANVLAATGAEDIEGLFRTACANAPEQFAGIVSPEVAPRYEIVLRHWRLGEARFVFSCTRPRKIAKRIELFRRRCAVNGTATPLADGLQELAARRLVPLEGTLRQRVADFYRRGNWFFVEMSWPIDGRGRPRIGTGRFRYPIGYPHDSHEARTGHSAYFNAPIASDNTRHGPARDEATNKKLRAACEALLIDALACHAIPKWGPYGLNPLVPSPHADNQDELVWPLLEALARRNAMPTLKWHEAVDLVVKSKTTKLYATLRHSLKRADGRLAREYNFVVPVATWEPSSIHSALAIITPRSEWQIDPRTPPAILRLLADGDTDGDTDGFQPHFITFDEDEALSRAAGNGNQYIDAPRAQQFQQPFVARAYLDVINDALGHEKCDQATENALLESMWLPDVHGKPARLDALHTSAPLPSDVPGLSLPPILHPDLVPHRLFKRKKWQRRKYTMARFLESGTLHDADEKTRRQFWNWLRRNERRIAPRDRPKLADLAIWPDEKGRLSRIPDLCEPRSRGVAAVLSDSIRRPSEQVRRSKLVSAGSKAQTSIRRIPTEGVITSWLDTRMAAFSVGDEADASTAVALGRFEADLVILLKDSGIARLLQAANVTLPALAQDGSIRTRPELVMPGRSNDRLALPSRFLLRDKHRSSVLDRLSTALSAPTAAMLLETFAEDPRNFSALQPRLRQFLTLTKPGDDERHQLADMPILPVHGELRRPSALAFAGNKGNYWGDWKTPISGKGLSQDDQRNYRAVGVSSALPNRETSRAFFQWLSAQNETVLRRHIPCVLRHILHQNGPANWAESFTDTPFIPAKGQNGVRLVPLRTAHHRPVFLPDVGDIGDAIIRRDHAVLLVIDHVREVTNPISEPLRKLGVRSLREALKEPENVSGTGTFASAGEDILSRLGTLRLPRFRNTFLKRLNALGVESELVRHDWQDRLSQLKGIRLADEVNARYRLRNNAYQVALDAGFDPGTGIIWMKRDHSVELSSLYDAIAAQLIFKPGVRPVDLFALERAVKLKVNDPSFGRPAGAGSPRDDNDITADGAGREKYGDTEGQHEGADTDPGEAIFGHSPFEPDAARNTPRPNPISSGPTGTSRRSPRGRSATSPGKGDSEPRPAPELEEEHKEALKRSHYASHCQMCLCERPPQELAPPGSYIQWEEVRRHVIDAHHADLVDAGGARHAGNLVVLCKLHHNNYGRRLTRAAITKALQGHIREMRINFGMDGESGSEVKGRKISLEIPDTGEIVEMFFTGEHADYWVSQAGPPADGDGTM